MKYLVMILIFTFVNSAFANKYRDAYIESRKELKSRNYFTALDLIASQYKYTTPSKRIQSYIEKLVTQTGTHYFNTFTDLELRKLNIPTTDLIMAKRNLYLRKFGYTHKRLKRMPKDHRLYPEALLVKGSAYLMDKKYTRALKTYKRCADVSSNWERKTEDKKKNYFAILKETCIINAARIHFKQKDYKKAITNYENIPKRSFKWPYTLLEKAWSYYYTGNYNRSLGILLTYNSPLLESYFTPEAEVLKALNYFKLCLYEDALETIDNYYTQYTPRSNKLKSVITSQADKPFYFFDLMFSPISESEKESKFLRNLVTQMTNRIIFNFDLN